MLSKGSRSCGLGRSDNGNKTQLCKCLEGGVRNVYLSGRYSWLLSKEADGFDVELLGEEHREIYTLALERYVLPNLEVNL